MYSRDEAAQIREGDLAKGIQRIVPVPVIPSNRNLAIHKTLHAHRAKRLGAMERLGLPILVANVGKVQSLGPRVLGNGVLLG